jgi:hypothetical protein
MMPVTNPKAWDAVTGFTATIKATVERLNEPAGYFPESQLLRGSRPNAMRR